jgi:hypothetical protein
LKSLFEVAWYTSGMRRVCVGIPMILPVAILAQAFSFAQM